MIKKDFKSDLFKRVIEKDEPDYIMFVKAELLYRIKYMERENCSCFKCNADLKKYRAYFDKIDPPKEKFNP